MPEKQKNIIFDLGAVMVDWNPQAIAQKFTNNTNNQQSIINGLFHHNNWIDFDNGLISEVELIQRTSKHLSISELKINKLMQQAKESLHAKQDMVSLLELAKSKGHMTYCLSNLSHEWFAYLNNRHDFFNLFDGKVISAQEGIGKPSIQIYQRLLKRYEVDVGNTLFIDDRADNTEAAISLGINSITFKHTKQDLEMIKQFILAH